MSKMIIRATVFVMALIAMQATAFAQLQLSLALRPPYSPYISDYLLYQNKALLTVINPPGSGISEIYFKGSIIGDNGISAVTNANFKPSSPTVLTGNTTILRGNDFESSFGGNNVTFKGVDVTTIAIGDGLPEGNYTVCLQAFDFRSDRAVSNNACYTINIRSVEPPIPNLPMCGSNALAGRAQFVNFVWSFPPGAPPNTRYLLKMVELLPNQNPNDALNSSTTPPFFEKELNTISYTYKISDPTLTVGKKYAWQVTAFDINKTVAFRNNGISSICTFTYGEEPPASNGITITAPDCKNDTLYTGSDKDMYISWIWSSLQSGGGTFTALKTVNGETINNYKVTLAPTTKNDKSLTITVPADKQYTNITEAQALNGGLLYGKRYQITVEAFNANNKSLGMAQSCKLWLAKYVSQSPNSVKVKGRLVYKLEDNGPSYGANNVSITLSARKTANDTYLKYTGNAATTTDSNGNFEVMMPASADTGLKFVNIYINNTYYKQFAANIPADLFYSEKKADMTKKQGSSAFDKFNTDPATVKTNKLKEQLEIGAITTDAYSYTLKVKMGKGFPEYYYDTLSKGYVSTYKIDEVSIDPKVKVKSGIPVTLYRKQKSTIVPRHEGDKDVAAKPAKSEVRVIVAEGVTSIEKNGTTETTVVIFKRLVCNLSPDDEYYIQATLNKSGPSSGGNYGGANKWKINPIYFSGEENEDDFLEAPEQVVKFDKKNFKTNISRYERTIDYKLISSKPPMSEISGNIVYAWPSKPSVVRPLANANFTVKVRYLFDGKSSMPVTSKPGCMTLHSGITLNDKASGTSYDPQNIVYSFQDGVVVGVGKTDDKGNFKLNIANYDQKGTISEDAQTFVIADCNEKKQTKPKDVIDGIKNKGQEVINPYDGLKDKGMTKGDIWGDKMKGDLGAKGIMTIDEAGISKFGSGDLTSGNLNDMMNGGMLTGGALTGANLGKGLKGGMGAKGVKGGPSAIDDDNDYGAFDPEYGNGGIKVERVFTLQIETPDGKFYLEPVNNNNKGELPSRFVVQAFDKANVGTFTAPVYESSKQIRIAVYKGKARVNIPLSKAKAVIYRNPDEKPDRIPDGEGSIKHPMKPLIQKSLKSAPGPDKEWIIEEGFDISYANNNNYLSVSKSALIGYIYGGYNVQIAPDPSKDGTTFEPAYGDFSDDTIKVTLGEGKLVGRATEKGAKSTPIPGGEVKIYMTRGNNVYTMKTYCDDEGYFEYVNGSGSLKWDYDAPVKDKLMVTVTKAGYKGYTSNTETAPDIGVQKYYDAKLEPKGTIKGVVVNEKGNAVDAYLMRDDSTITSTPMPLIKIGGGSIPMAFEVKVPSGGKHTLTIIPEDPAYFDTTLVINPMPDGVKDYGNIVMPKRKHRMRFFVERYNASGAIITGNVPNAFRITINNDSKLSVVTDNVQQALMTFENVSVSNYTILIEDVTGSGYIPQTINISNEESRDYVKYYIKMKLGGTIVGKVTLDGKAVKNAKVYIDKQTSGNSTSQSNAYNQMETRSAFDGTYTLKGIPKTSSALTVQATLDTSFTVNGASKDVTLNDGKGNADLALVTVSNAKLNKLWKFPISVENIKANGTGKYLVTGLVDLSQNNSNFDWLDKNTKVRVTDVPFVTASNGQDLVPEKNTVTLERSALKMKYRNRYNVEVLDNDVTFEKVKMGAIYVWVPKTKAITITKADEGGVIRSRARIVDNSYNYPSTYINFENTGDFFFGISEGSKVNTTVPAITSNANNSNTSYRLSSEKGDPLAFTFVGFNATAAPQTSYIDEQGKIHLDIAFKGTIPNTDPGYVNVRMKDVVLDENKIEAAPGSEPISIKLDKSSSTWTLLVKDWKLDPKEGGLYSENSVIQTGVVDIKAKKFNLRHNLFVLDNFDMKQITLGNGTLKLDNVSTNAALVFDHKTGSDLGKHWRFNIAPKSNGDPAATAYLDEAKTQKLDIDYLQLISYANENIITLSKKNAPVPIGNNSRITFNPKSISSSNGFFVLSGEATFGVPRMPAIGMNVNYTKVDNKLTQSLQPLNFNFEGKGYVKYTNNNTVNPTINASTGLITFDGEVVEPGKFAPIPCKFSFGTSNAGQIDLKVGHELPLTAATKEASKTNIIIGERKRGGKMVNGMDVSNNDWTTLHFSGLVKDNSGSKTMDPNNVLDFEVLGEITANTEGIKASQIPTPFGNVDMTFDFATKMLHGVMVMDQTQFGSWKFSGDVEVNFGPQGWNVIGAGQLNTGVLLAEGFGTFSAGMVLGSYDLTQPMIDKTTQFSKDPSKGCWLDENKTGFKGFYFTGGYDVLNKSEGFDIGIAALYFNAVLGIEASLGANIGKGYMLGVGAHGLVKAGLKAITGTSVKGALEAHLTAMGTMVDLNNFGVDGAANVGISIEVCQSYLIDEVCWGMSKGAGVKCGFGKNKKSYFDFYFSDGNSQVQCNKSKQ